MAELIIRTGKQKGKKIRLSLTDVVVGRDEDCQIRLDTDDVSRRHCSLKPSPKGWLIQDLGSRNGTCVNGERIENETLLQHGDLLGIGPVEFQFFVKPGSRKKSGNIGAFTEKESPKGKSNITTDDEIADWLMEEDENSAVVSGAETEETSISQKLDETKSQSIKVEAEDIIRRHLETQSRNN